MDSLNLKLNSHFPSGFILQKDVYTTNLLYANDQLPISQLSKLLPFRPPTGRKPQDPSNCLQIIRQNGFISYNTENEDLFYAKNTFKPKKLRHRKLKFPIPKYRTPPLSAVDFYSRLRDKNIRIKYIDDDLNITSRNGKKIFFTFKNKYNNNNYDNNHKYIQKNKILTKKENKLYDEYFDYGFHSRFKDIFNDKENKKGVSQLRLNSHHKKVYAKDNTFTTQIDFNILNKKFMNRARTANERSKNIFNKYQKLDSII